MHREARVSPTVKTDFSLVHPETDGQGNMDVSAVSLYVLILVICSLFWEETGNAVDTLSLSVFKRHLDNALNML